MTLTKQLIDACRRDNGTFTKATIQAIGLSWPMQKGWIHRLIGTEITEERYRQALEGRGILSAYYTSPAEPAPKRVPESIKVPVVSPNGCWLYWNDQWWERVNR